MKYNILCIADIHWDAIDAQTKYDHMGQIFTFIKLHSSIDLIVILGDYFDSKLSLNSKSARLAIYWMNELYQLCREYDIKIRIIKGTEGHDNDQLTCFNNLLYDTNCVYADELFDIFNENTREETLPGLFCLYCPDENISTEEYKDKYMANYVNYPNHIGFFHGNFDTILNPSLIQLIENGSMKSIIYEHEYWTKFINGPMIAGHWHDSVEYKNFIYVGSFDRWQFDEDNPKGFGFLQYNTENNTYYYKHIENLLATEMKTYEIFSNIADSIGDFRYIMDEISSKIENAKAEGMKLFKARILIHVLDENPRIDEIIDTVKKYYSKNEYVKVTIKNHLKTTKKKTEEKKQEELNREFGFIKDKNRPIAEIIKEYILKTKGKDLDIDNINRIIQKYLPN